MRKDTVERLRQIKNLSGMGHAKEAQEALRELQIEQLDVLDEMGAVLNVRISPSVLKTWMTIGTGGGPNQLVRLGAVLPQDDGFYNLVFTVEELSDATQAGEEQEGDQPEHQGADEIGPTAETSDSDSNEQGGQEPQEEKEVRKVH